MKPVIDLTNVRFGRLTVLHEAGRNKFGHVLWYCQCDCGIHVTVSGNRLKYYTKSCGCLLKETARIQLVAINTRYKLSRGIDPHSKLQSENATLRDQAKTVMAESKRLDSYTCQLCRQHGGDLHSHHIIPIVDNPSLSCDPNNIITLCTTCHKLAHDNNTHGPVNAQIQKLLQMKKNSVCISIRE